MTSLDYQLRREQVQDDFKRLMKTGLPIALKKSTTNEFRFRRRGKNERAWLDVTGFNHIDIGGGIANVGGTTRYDNFVAATLDKGFVPPVAPELKSITVGGEAVGIGVESSCFRYGFVHETFQKMDVLTGTGDVVTCSPTQNSDLFFGIPNSFGSFGTVLNVRMPLISAKEFVETTRIRFNDYGEFVERMRDESWAARTDGKWDYIDGLVFKPDEMYLNLARFEDNPETVSDYTGMNIFYKSMDKAKDATRTDEYIFRYDTDYFWAARAMGLENPLLRRAFHTMGWLRSDVYRKILGWDKKLGFSDRMHRRKGRRFETLIQDAEVPVEYAPEFLEWFQTEITDQRPLTITAVVPYSHTANFPLFSMEPKTMYMNIGYYAAVPTTEPDGHYNRMFEKKLIEIAGRGNKAKKMMYSGSQYTEDEFWEIFDRSAYDHLKSTYDPDGVFPGLYDKCVRKQ